MLLSPRSPGCTRPWCSGGGSTRADGRRTRRACCRRPCASHRPSTAPIQHVGPHCATYRPAPSVPHVLLQDACQQCIICFERPRTNVFVPCGHFVSCDICVTLVTDCPSCRQRITSKVTICFRGICEGGGRVCLLPCDDGMAAFPSHCRVCFSAVTFCS